MALLHLHLLRNWTSKIPGWTILERLKMWKVVVCFSNHDFSWLTLVLMVLQDHAPSSTVVHLGIAVSGMGSTRKELRWLKSKLLLVVLLSSKSKKNPTRSGGRWLYTPGSARAAAGLGGFLLLPSAAHCWPVILRMAKRVKKSFQTINGQCLVHAASIWTKIVPKIAPY